MSNIKNNYKYGAGDFGEKFAKDYLESRNFNIIVKNYRKPWGEVDIICEKSGVYIFVEVKTSMAKQKGFEPELRADKNKMAKVVRAARTFLAERKLNDCEWRLDIISIILNGSGGVADLKHFENIDY